MKSFTRTTIASGLLTVVLVNAQYTVDPMNVDKSTRDYWCTQQITACPLICLDQGASTGITAESNDCDPDALQYSCVCDNGMSPNLTEYSQTLPYFLCTEWGTECVSDCGPDTSCAAACRQDHPCGASDPTRQNTSTLSSTRTSATMSGTGTASLGDNTAVTTDSSGVTLYSGYAGGSPSSTANNNGGSGGGDTNSASTIVRVWALSAGQTFGTLSVMGAAALAFAVLL